MRHKVQSHHQSLLISQSTNKSSMRFINFKSLSLDVPKPHSIWEDCGTSRAIMHKTAYRAKMLAGSYLLQNTLAKSYVINKDPRCLLCKLEVEDIPHFIMHCPQLDTPRTEEMAKINCRNDFQDGGQPTQDRHRMDQDHTEWVRGSCSVTCH